MFQPLSIRPGIQKDGGGAPMPDRQEKDIELNRHGDEQQHAVPFSDAGTGQSPGGFLDGCGQFPVGHDFPLVPQGRMDGFLFGMVEEDGEKRIVVCVVHHSSLA